MDYIEINKDNIDKEHVCCAMSNVQAIAKKQWLKDRFDEGLVFYRSAERGKCFIEYIPAENAWVPIEADDYLFIDCLWIAGSFKGHGYSNDLLEKCISDGKKQNKQGICILSSNKRKKEFLADPSYLAYKGFLKADETDCDISLMYLPLIENASIPRFKQCAKQLHCDEKGWVVYHSDQCPFTNYWVDRVVRVASENGITLKAIHITTKQQAQNMGAPIIMYGLFKDGKFVTSSIQTDKKFLQLVSKNK